MRRQFDGHISRLLEIILEANPLQVAFLMASVAHLEISESKALESYIAYCLSAGFDYGYLAECYNTIVRDTLKEQLYFQRHGRYRHSSYIDVAASVYQNEDYMKRYMYGLALTTYLWPNHRTIHRCFVDALPRQQDGQYLEIGPGHGVYFMNAMRLGRFRRYLGIDISPTSIALTRSLLSSGNFGHFSNYEFACTDFLADQVDGRFQAVVMGEVLEHVENPLAFLKKIRSLADHKAFVFVTTAINAPAIDHIYLYDSPEAVTEMAVAAGFRVLKAETAPYPGLTLQQSLVKKLPINIALVMEPE